MRKLLGRFIATIAMTLAASAAFMAPANAAPAPPPKSPQLVSISGVIPVACDGGDVTDWEGTGTTSSVDVTTPKGYVLSVNHNQGSVSFRIVTSHPWPQPQTEVVYIGHIVDTTSSRTKGSETIYNHWVKFVGTNEANPSDRLVARLEQNFTWVNGQGTGGSNANCRHL